MTTPPSIRRAEMATLDEGQVRQLLVVVAGDRLEALLVMALAAGMRRGELMTLKWADIDLDKLHFKCGGRFSAHHTAGSQESPSRAIAAGVSRCHRH